MIVINERQRNILNYLVATTEEYVVVSNIAKKLNVSTKTIYRDIKALNKNEKFHIKCLKGKGIKIQILDRSVLGNETFKKISISKRRYDIYYELLISSPNPKSLKYFSEKYYVGELSVINDLKYVENNLMYKDLKLNKSRKGTLIEGKEEDIRKAIIQLLKVYKIENNIVGNKKSYRLSNFTYTELSNKFGEENLKIIESIIKKAEKKLKYQLGDIYYVNFCTHLMILVERIKKGQSISKNRKNTEIDDFYSNVIDDILKDLEKKFNIKINDEEKYNIYQYLASSGLSKINDLKDMLNDIKDNKYILELVEKIKEEINLDIRKNVEVYQLFLIHTRSLLNRLNFKIEITNPILEDIIVNYKSLFEDIKRVKNKLSKNNILINMNDSEISYICLYYQLILENIKKKKNVLIICTSGLGTSQLLKIRINKRISNINVIDVISDADLENYNKKNIDFVISTVKIESPSIPVIYTSVLLNDEDIASIKEVIGND